MRVRTLMMPTPLENQYEKRVLKETTGIISIFESAKARGITGSYATGQP